MPVKPSIVILPFSPTIGGVRGSRVLACPRNTVPNDHCRGRVVSGFLRVSRPIEESGGECDTLAYGL